MNMKMPLMGVVPPLVTPLRERDELDVAGIERALEHVLGGGVDGVFILGTTGEAAALSPAVKRELIQRACRFVGGRVPVLVGITDTWYGGAVEIARIAAECGAAAVVTSTPYYLPLLQEELVSYVRSLAADQPLPIVLYNIPVLTKTAFEPQTVAKLAEMPTVIGIKDSSGKIEYVKQIRSMVKRKDFSVMVGMENLLGEGIKAGAQGCVPAGANVAPRVFTGWYAAAAAGDWAKAAEYEKKAAALARIYRSGEGLAGIVRGVKCALGLMGICGEKMAAPFIGMDSNGKERVRQHLSDVGITLSARL